LKIEQLKNIKAWIFDLDDTLFLERDFVFGGYRAVATKIYDDFSINIESELRRRFLRGERGDLFTIILRQVGLDADEKYIKELVGIYRNHQPNIQPFVDVIPTLEYLIGTGGKIGLITDGWWRVQKNKLTALGIQDLFDAVVFTDKINGVKSWKPSGEGYQKCLNQLKIGPENAIYIGDNPKKDFVGARKLGILTIRVRRKDGEHEHRLAPSPTHEPNLCISSLKELLDYI